MKSPHGDTQSFRIRGRLPAANVVLDLTIIQSCNEFFDKVDLVTSAFVG